MAKALTSIIKVDLGRWKLVSRAPTDLNSKPGVMKRLVSPRAGMILPWSRAMVSRVRMAVVPTAIRRVAL